MKCFVEHKRLTPSEFPCLQREATVADFAEEVAEGRIHDDDGDAENRDNNNERERSIWDRSPRNEEDASTAPFQ